VIPTAPHGETTLFCHLRKDHFNERFPAYIIDASSLTNVPGLPHIYVDAFPNLRRQVLENNAKAYDSLNDTANAEAARAAIEVLQQQQELSPLENIVLIVETGQ
jgi:hypothetical protein